MRDTAQHVAPLPKSPGLKAAPPTSGGAGAGAGAGAGVGGARGFLASIGLEKQSLLFGNARKRTPIESMEDKERNVRVFVGGSVFLTTLGTLTCREPTSTFAQRLMSMNLAGTGVIELKFLDRNPKRFLSVLNYLRTGRAPSTFKHVHDIRVLLDEAMFYQLGGLVSRLKSSLRKHQHAEAAAAHHHHQQQQQQQQQQPHAVPQLLPPLPPLPAVSAGGLGTTTTKALPVPGKDATGRNLNGGKFGGCLQHKEKENLRALHDARVASLISSNDMDDGRDEDDNLFFAMTL